MWCNVSPTVSASGSVNSSVSISASVSVGEVKCSDAV